MNIIKSNLSFGALTKRSRTQQIILHHAVMNGGVEDIHRVHLNQGYSGIGYHYYVRKDGSIYEGRPSNTIGAHASGSNSNSIGICFEGNFENEYMSDAQKNAGKELVAYLKDLYKISVVKKHCDVNATACPGKNFPFGEIAGATDYKIDTNANANVDNEVYDENEVLKIVKVGQQHAENFTGYDLDIDGKRGPQTKKAGIMVLQTALNLDYKAMLAVDGIWGNASKKAFGSHYVKQGEKQYLVTALEILLMLKGYNPKGVENPGEYGKNLEKAVKKYQKNNGLTVDGVAGYYTFMSLIA